MTFKNVINITLTRLLFTALSCVALSLTSCEDLYDNRTNCVSGIQLRFVYEYHMEPGANSFAKNVDCVEVFVFDKEGNYITTYSETSYALLGDENYRMILPLAEGDYHLMIYGGLACDRASFIWDYKSRSSITSISDLTVSLPLTNGVSDSELHNIEKHSGGLFYGTLDVSVTNADYGTTYTEHTVKLMKDTNNIQIILEEIASPFEVDYADYEFTIIDDNFKIDSSNNPIHIADDNSGFQPVYKPYFFKNSLIGYVEPGYREGAPVYEDESRPVQVGCVEFSTSRLFTDHMNSARLIITSNKEHEKDGSNKKIVDLPFITYLAKTQGFGMSWIKSDQEYLDRQSNWTLFFFLQHGKWINTTIAVNSWTVRVNDIELGH